MKIMYYSPDEQYEKLCIDAVRKVSKSAKIYICHSLAAAGKKLMMDRMDIVIFNLHIRRKDDVDQEGIRFLDRLRRVPGYALTPIMILMDLEDVYYHTYNRLHAYACYRKPLNEAVFSGDMTELVRETERNAGTSEWENTIHCFRKNEELYMVLEEEVVRVEKTHDKGLVVTTEREYDVDVRALRKDSRLFYSGHFIRCSRTNYVNPKYIRKVDRDCVKLEDKYGEVKLTETGYRDVVRRMNEIQEKKNKKPGSPKENPKGKKDFGKHDNDR